MNRTTLSHIAQEWDCIVAFTLVHRNMPDERELATFWHDDQPVWGLFLIEGEIDMSASRLAYRLAQSINKGRWNVA